MQFLRALGRLSLPFCLFSLALSASLLPAAPCAAQSQTTIVKLPPHSLPVPAPVPAKPDYSGEPLVIEHELTTFRYNADGSGEHTLRAVLHLQSDAAVRQYGVLSFPYSADNESVELRSIRVRKPDGSLVSTDLDGKRDLTADVTREAPLYTDQHQLQIPVQSLAVGDRLEYEVVIHKLRAETPGAFWEALYFEKNIVTLDQQLELRYPTASSLNVQSPHLKAVIHTDGADTVYTWHAEQTKPSVPAPGTEKDAAKDTPAPAIIPDVAWTTFHDWAAVGAWYRSLSADRAAPDAAIRARAAALTAGAATDDERIHRLYSFVATEIRYVGIDLGAGRFQPHRAGEVLSNGYGDCKDKHTLLAALLSAAGIQADPVLIGAGIHLDRDLPAPNNFNHVITAVRRADGSRLWLDSTSEVAPEGMLLAGLRDVDALLIPPVGQGVPTLVKTPATLPFAASDHYEARGTLSSDGKLTGHFDATLHGDLEFLCRVALFSTTRSQWPQVGQGISNALGFGGEVSAFTPTGVDQPTQPLHLAYDYKRDTYGDWPNHRILALLPYSLFSGATFDKQPEQPISLGAPRTELATSTITLPTGFTIPTLPQNVHTESSFATFDLSYRLQGSDLITSARLDVRKPSLPAEQWAEYNSFQHDIDANNGVFLTLSEGTTPPVPADKDKSAVTATAAQPVTTNSPSRNAAAQALLRESMASLRSGHLDEAAAKVDAARALSPDEPGLWGLAGTIAGQRLHYDEAITDYHKEVALYPDSNERVLPFLLWAQLRGKHRDDAILTLESLRKLHPDNTAFTRQEGALLTEAGRHEDAIALLEEAALANPSDKTMLLALGNAQFAAGRNREGQRTLENALHGAEDAELLNDISYELANRGLDLEPSQQASAESLHLLESRTNNISLASVTAKDLATQRLITSTWDTVGWVAYQQGDTARAETYLYAAWRTAQSPVMGYHLGMLYEKQGRLREALDTYLLSTSQHEAGPVPEPDGKALLARLAALSAQNDKNPAHVSAKLSEDPATRLAKMRSLQLPLLSKTAAEADFWVLADTPPSKAAASTLPIGLLPSLPIQVHFIEGDKTLSGQEQAIRSALLHDRSILPIPAGTDAHLLRRGILSCSPSIHSCQFVLFLPGDTKLPDPQKAPEQAVAAQ